MARAAGENSFAAASRGCYRTTAPPQLHAMIGFDCYFDDSADARRARCYACGGLMARADEWDRFDKRWGTETQKLSDPFHATDCESGQRQFKNWSEAKRHALMDRLVSVIRECRLYGFASIVPIGDYKSAFPGCGEHEPFLLAATQTMMDMAALADRAGTDAGLWFENSQLTPRIAEIFESIRDSKWAPSRRLSGIHTGPKSLRPLQAADLIAREAFKYSDKLGVLETRRAVRRLSRKLYFVRWTRAALENLARAGGPGNIAALSGWDSDPAAPKLEMFWKSF